MDTKVEALTKAMKSAKAPKAMKLAKAMKAAKAMKSAKVVKKCARWMRDRPFGCSKCRRIPGCTPSCWRARGELC